MQWPGGGAGPYGFATRFHFRLQRQFGGPPPVNDMDEWTTGTEMVHAQMLDPDTTYFMGVQAWNDWGKSDWARSKFDSEDVPDTSGPGPGTGPGPGPGTQPEGPSAIVFYNCDVTTDPDTSGFLHLPVIFWLQDLSAGNALSQIGPINAGYNDAGTCGAGFSQPVTIPLTAGHAYQWSVVKPDDPNCDGNPQPGGDCQAWSGTITGGTGPAVTIQWPP